MIGKQFGRWTVLGRHSVDSNRSIKYFCVCECGVKKAVSGHSLRNGSSKSCGCFQKQRAVETHTTHGLTASRTYNTWHSMIKRCKNESEPYYNNYGGRGIRVCDEWLTFQGFLSDMGERPKNLTLDRIDVNGNYERLNCRWATQDQQRANTRTQKRNKTGITGVRVRNLDNGPIYTSRITVSGKEKMLYHGPDFFEACCARKPAELIYK